MFKNLLNEIDLLLAKNLKEVFNSLQPGASKNELESFEQKLFSNRKVPKEISILYEWHNGQIGQYSLNQDDNRTFLPIKKVIKARQFLNDPMAEILQPWSSSWIPILYNGAGDYIVYETEGENKGKLISYWHDDEDRDVEYESLEDWAKAILKAATKTPPTINF